MHGVHLSPMHGAVYARRVEVLVPLLNKRHRPTTTSVMGRMESVC